MESGHSRWNPHSTGRSVSSLAILRNWDFSYPLAIRYRPEFRADHPRGWVELLLSLSGTKSYHSSAIRWALSCRFPLGLFGFSNLGASGDGLRSEVSPPDSCDKRGNIRCRADDHDRASLTVAFHLDEGHCFYPLLISSPTKRRGGMNRRRTCSMTILNSLFVCNIPGGVPFLGTSPKKTIALLPQILIVYKRDIHIR